MILKGSSSYYGSVGWIRALVKWIITETYAVAFEVGLEGMFAVEVVVWDVDSRKDLKHLIYNILLRWTDKRNDLSR